MAGNLTGGPGRSDAGVGPGTTVNGVATNPGDGIGITGLGIEGVGDEGGVGADDCGPTGPAETDRHFGQSGDPAPERPAR